MITQFVKDADSVKDTLVREAMNIPNLKGEVTAVKPNGFCRFDGKNNEDNHRLWLHYTNCADAVTVVKKEGGKDITAKGEGLYNVVKGTLVKTIA